MEIVSLNQISPDQVILWSWGFITLNVTILYTWLVMTILVVGSWLVTRNLSSEMHVSRWQHFLEVIISIIRGEIGEMTKKGADHYIPLVGTLFLFICTSNVLAVVPGYVAPTSSITLRPPAASIRASVQAGSSMVSGFFSEAPGSGSHAGSSLNRM